MAAELLFRSDALAVRHYRCTAGLGARPYDEQHRGFTAALVLSGSFGYRLEGRAHELVPGAILAGRPGQSYRCTHDHVCGDQCLSLHLSEETVEQLAGDTRRWRGGGLPPTAETMVAGALLTGAARGRSTLALEEAALLFARHFLTQTEAPEETPAVGAQGRRRAVESALMIEARAAEPLDLAAGAAAAGLSHWHYLRLFRAALGVTPHQYLLRCRLRRAARLLAEGEGSITDVAYDAGFADLSNFVRSFRRAAGMSPRAFRRAARGERKFLQEAPAGRFLG